MRIFVYEFISASLADWPASLRREGQAMLAALLADFAVLPDVETMTIAGRGVIKQPKVSVISPKDDPLAQIRELAARADATLLIAPDDLLADLQTTAGRVGRVWGCEPAAIRLTANKLALFDHWQKLAVPTPPTRLWSPELNKYEFPLVVKPIQGCGSQDVRVIADAQAWAAFAPTEPFIVQPLWPGLAASVSFLIGSAGCFPLLAGRQCLSDDGHFAYLGGELPLPSELAERAARLASRAVACVPGLRGYVSVDLILGRPDDGSADVVIEINPRLTTSYVGLRALSRVNLAAQIQAVECGAEPTLCWQSGQVQFSPAGEVQFA